MLMAESGWWESLFTIKYLNFTFENFYDKILWKRCYRNDKEGRDLGKAHRG